MTKSELRGIIADEVKAVKGNHPGSGSERVERQLRQIDQRSYNNGCMLSAITFVVVVPAVLLGLGWLITFPAGVR
jgi:hypothetical protein